MNEAVQKIVFDISKSASANGPWHVDYKDFISSDVFNLTDALLVDFGPDSWAANHKHLQEEILVGLRGDLFLVWREADGTRREEKLMREDGQLQAFVIASLVPHLIENRSKTFGTMQVWAGINDVSTSLEGDESLR